MYGLVGVVVVVIGVIVVAVVTIVVLVVGIAVVVNVCIGSFYSCRYICLESCLAFGTTGSGLNQGLLIKVSFKNKKRHPSLCTQRFTPSHHCRAAGRHTSGDSSVSANGGSKMSARVAALTQ